MKNHKFYPIIGVFLLLSMAISVSATTVPYDGLTLELAGEYSFTNLDASSANSKEDINFIFLYKSEDENVIQQKNLDKDKDELVNLETREILTGDSKGQYTSHWIPTDIKLGDKIKILGKEYTVKSLSDSIYLRDFGQIEAIKVSYKEEPEDKVDDDGGSWNDNVVEVKNWYDPNSGLKLKSIYTSSTKHITTYFSWRKVTKTEYELKENNVDTDKDGLTDLKELLELQTSPISSDSDSDNVADQKEIEIGTNPTSSDSDNDGLNDGEEIEFKSNPLKADSDGEGLNDKEEKEAGTDPNLADTDGDGLSDKEEIDAETNPLVSDTDGDGLNDKEEKEFGSDPLKTDSDGDDLNDKEEKEFGSDPLKTDSDGDGLNDKEEFEFKTNPEMADSDKDYWNDKIDIAKNSFIIPNGLFVVVILLIVGFLIYKILKTQKNKTKSKH